MKVSFSMRDRILNFLRVHPLVLNTFWKLMGKWLSLLALFIPVKDKTMLFSSFGGRKFDDSPKAIYEEICKRKEFDDWDIIWAFVEPDKYTIRRGRKVKIDTFSFFYLLLYSKVWISNSGMSRGINLAVKKKIVVETWHGTPLKKIGVDQNSGILGKGTLNKENDKHTIRCAQSEYDREIFVRVFNADKSSFLLSDLPRNDELVNFSKNDIIKIKEKIGLNPKKKVLLYMPTYREYLVNERNQTYLAPPMNLKKWKQRLGEGFVLLFRAHYAVNAALNLKEDGFVKDVSDYPYINDLYCVADILISDYSSAYIDFSILDKPMLCFAYDFEEYNEKRGLYLDLNKVLPCPVDKDEDTVIDRILHMDYEKESLETHFFHMKFAPYAGNASKVVINKIIDKLKAYK